MFFCVVFNIINNTIKLIWAPHGIIPHGML